MQCHTLEWNWKRSPESVQKNRVHNCYCFCHLPIRCGNQTIAISVSLICKAFFKGSRNTWIGGPFRETWATAWQTTVRGGNLSKFWDFIPSPWAIAVLSAYTRLLQDPTQYFQIIKVPQARCCKLNLLDQSNSCPIRSENTALQNISL